MDGKAVVSATDGFVPENIKARNKWAGTIIKDWGIMRKPVPKKTWCLVNATWVGPVITQCPRNSKILCIYQII